MKKAKIKTGKRISVDDWVKEREAMAPVVQEKRINFALSEDLHHRFSMACAREKESMKEVLTRSIEEYISAKDKL